jgi:hypothetical protein
MVAGFRTPPLTPQRISAILEDPTVEQTYQVLKGTIAINQGLKDSRFTLDYGLSPNEKPDRRGSQQSAKWSRSESSGSRLTKEFSKAEAVSPELVAEPPSQQGWFTRYLPSVGLFFLGFAVLLIASF